MEEPSKPGVDSHESKRPIDSPEAAAVDITASALPHGHYDPKNDVILKLECMRAWEVRVSILPGQASPTLEPQKFDMSCFVTGSCLCVDGSSTCRDISV